MTEQASKEFQTLYGAMIEGFEEVKRAIELNANNMHDKLAVDIDKLKDHLHEADAIMKLWGLPGHQTQQDKAALQIFPNYSISRSATLTEHCEQEIVRLGLENGQIIEENRRLLTTVDLAHSTAEEYRRENEKLTEICAKLEAQNEKSEQRRAELKHMILKDARSSEEPLDADVATLFCEIRAKIQTLIHDFYSTSPARPLEQIHQSNAHKSQKAWFKTWNSDPESIRHARSRAFVFNYLHEQIFNRPCFGLTGDLEERLVEFEDLISETNADKKSDIADWRVRTISLAPVTGFQSPKPQQTADSIYNYLYPLLLPKSKTSSAKEPDAQKGKIEAMILEICTKAYALTMKMRQSRSTYQIIGIDGGERFNGYDETPSFTPQETLVPRDKLVSSRVNFTIFGALVKVPTGADAGERHFLEKAHVVCQ